MIISKEQLGETQNSSGLLITVVSFRRQKKNKNRAEDIIGKKEVIVQIMWFWLCLVGNNFLASISNA